MENLIPLLGIAKKAALKSGDYLKENFSLNNEASFDDGRDIKLKIDVESEDLILKMLRENSNIPILSEESGANENLGKTYWVVDPLDGSSNYFRKIRICAVSIALIHEGKPILGVINDFMNDDLYYGSKNEGAFCNDVQIKVSSTNAINKGTIMSGIPAKQVYSNEEFTSMIELFQQWKKVRMIGSAAVANLYVADGRADCYEEKDTFIWDVAAGAIIVEEAGGLANLSEIRDDFRVNAKFTNGKII